MFGSNVLEFALGMVFVYLLLSLLCSAVSEAIEARLKNRAKDLEKGLKELLKDPDGTGLVKKIYDHPLVSSLFKDAYETAKKKGNLPSYIPARNFALALMDIALPASGDATSGAKGATASSGSTSPPDPNSVEALRNAINTNLSKNPEVQKALLTLADAAGGNINKARENIESWFNTSMDRVSGWYKRRSHTITLILGLLIASVMNADTITIGQALSTNDTLRKTLAATAEASAKRPPPEAGKPDPDQQVKKIRDEIEKLGLPLGWNWKSIKDDPDHGLPFKAGVINPGEPDRYENLRWFVKKILGLLLTAIAISLGAPFWFDMLNKIIIVRSTVKPHEKSPEEASKQ